MFIMIWYLRRVVSNHICMWPHGKPFEIIPVQRRPRMSPRNLHPKYIFPLILSNESKWWDESLRRQEDEEVGGGRTLEGLAWSSVSGSWQLSVMITALQWVMTAFRRGRADRQPQSSLCPLLPSLLNTNIQTNMQAHWRTALAHTHTHTHTNKHNHTQTGTHTNPHKHTNTYKQAYTHTDRHTHALNHRQSKFHCRYFNKMGPTEAFNQWWTESWMSPRLMRRWEHYFI